METLVDRVTSAFREQMWRAMILPGAAETRRARAERIWLRLLRRGFAAVARDPEMHLYLAWTAETQGSKRDLIGFLRERSLHRSSRQKRISPRSGTPSDTEQAAQANALTRLSRLPPRARFALLARRRDRMSYEDIGQRLGCSADQARNLFVRALRMYSLSGKDRL